ncbi:SusD/RagB family nutrient-binding outer membrane lipoprotein [Joostella sp. CR20]|uniref:SusD/RagB family nutrient-binding outer membrane lipoprotein n=1 Tax=Joostella sp. CR20 TaxID=2804312 RepID=UPI00313F19FB
MKNIKYKVSILLVSFALFTSCGDDYFDVNTPSGTATDEQITMGDLLGPVIHSTMEGQYSAELVFGNYTQYFVSQGGVAAGRTEASGLWSQIYLRVLPNLSVVKEKAEASNSIHYKAVAEILEAINMGIATDTWDNVPYSEAALEVENVTPIFDSQEAVYTDIFNLLDDAISLLKQTDNSDFQFGKGDLIYGGDTDKWLRLAYTIKARYQLHLVNKGVVTANEVLTSINNGFTSNDDNFQMFYSDKNINPWYSVEVVAKSTGNFHHDICEQLVSSMNGDYYPFTSGTVEIDPRLPVFADNGGEEEWKGYVSGGEGNAPDGTSANTGFAENTFFTSIDSPLVLITYAEAMFIKAEASFLANGGTTTSSGTTAEGYNAYLDGIKASMEQYDVDGTDYLNDASVAVTESALQLKHIMKEKYIHNFLNPETFVDFRRYDFSADVFEGLELRVENGETDTEFSGQWFRRADYPASERNRNPANVQENEKEPTDAVWWDE